MVGYRVGAARSVRLPQSSEKLASIGTIYEDVTTDVLGLMGTWQWLVTMLLTVLMMPAMLNQYEDMFLLKPTNYIKCELPEIHDIVNSICEIASNSWRTYLITIVTLPRVFAIAYIVPMANSLPNLETFNFMACVFCLVCIILLRWLPESPHWLLYSRKVFLAEKILFKAALKNKIKLCSDFKIRPVNHKAYNCLDENRTCINIFYAYNSRIIDINISFVHTAALSTGMMGHTILLSITPRLFAINVRATIFGCCHSSGQLGTIICYLLYLLDYDDHKSLIFVQIGATFILTALCYVIPDVDGRELPDIVEDMDYFSELSKPLRWVTQKTNSPSQEEVEMRIYSFGSTVRNSSINSHSAERIPARAIGFKNLWQSLVSSVRHELR
ncbi:hypothetical protein RR46_06599 [Papilio xuthus]|uniref:Uncharacterized protein n=1 Tax=Papilio xuthus TaxID=66420 RepID=A0A194PMD3_PAPXU|nr:hypothetical protein RR46_06599 [Papilio xuthus]